MALLIAPADAFLCQNLKRWVFDDAPNNSGDVGPRDMRADPRRILGGRLARQSVAQTALGRSHMRREWILRYRVLRTVACDTR